MQENKDDFTEEAPPAEENPVVEAAAEENPAEEKSAQKIPTTCMLKTSTEI